MAIYIKTNQIDISQQGIVTINNQDLINNLIQDNQNTLSFLSHNVSPISATDISMDSEGKVVINSEVFRTNLSNKLPVPTDGGPIVKNGVCGNACRAL